MEVIYKKACGIDVHKSFIVAVICNSTSIEPKYLSKRFSNFNNSLTFKVEGVNSVQQASKIIVFTFQTQYSIVSNYDASELKEIGFGDNEIQNIKRIAIYDEIILNPDLSKVE